MTTVFVRIVEMSLTASIIIIAVLFLRLLLKKAPKWISVLLWGIVAFRLVCPFTIESVLSLMPSEEVINTEILTHAATEVVADVEEMPTNTVITEKSVDNLQLVVNIICYVWIAGVAVMLAYTIFSYWRLKKKIGTAVLLRDDIYQSENVVSPFVLGIIKPKIYLPFNISEQNAENVIAHEKAHIRRKDHFWKPLGYLILMIHWFNPLIWLGYILLCRDIELACDEKVVKNFDKEQKAEYSQALLSCSVNRRVIAACPLAFGEVGVKKRVKSVLNYKKPAFWIIVVSIVLCAVVAVCFLTSPKKTHDDAEDDEKIQESITETTFYSDYKGIYITLESVKKISEKSAEINVIWHNDTDKKAECSPSYRAEYRYEGSNILTHEEYDGFGRFDLKQKSTCQKIYFVNNYYESKKGICEIHSSFTVDGEHKMIVITIPIPYNNPEKEKTEISIEQLKEKFPHYFNPSYGNLLEVYIWQMAEGQYSCGLGPHTNMVTPKEFIWGLQTSPATLEEMRAIVASYNIPKNQVVITPVVMPHSSYHYEINQEYREKVTELFWAE